MVVRGMAVRIFSSSAMRRAGGTVTGMGSMRRAGSEAVLDTQLGEDPQSRIGFCVMDRSLPSAVDPSERVRLGLRISYALPALALAVVGIPVYVYMPKFYTDVMGLSAASAGSVLLAVRLFDALSDPLCGWISDRTRTSLGRRRPYILFGAFPLAASLWGLFHPPAWSGDPLRWWFSICVFAVFLFWTIVEVPYEALGPEITLDYDERTRLLGLRDGFVLAGILMAAAFPALLGAFLPLPETGEGERTTFRLMGALYAPFLVAACIVCATRVHERHPLGSWPAAPLSFRQNLKASLKNRPFVILLFAYTVSAFGSNLPATLILYYVQYVLGSAKADVYLMIYFVTGIVFLPAWIRLATAFGKKEAWMAAMAINTSAFAGVFFLGRGDEVLYAGLVFLSGMGFGGTVALPSAMQADVIDYHQWLTGERLEGFYIGVWSVAKKLAAAVGVGAALMLLGHAGYEPNVVQSEPVLVRLRLLYALVPSLCNAFAMAVAWAYPLDRKTHAALRRALSERSSGPWRP